MNRDDVTRMAREAGFVGFDGSNGSLRRFAALVAAVEREACVHIVLTTPQPEDEYVPRYQAIVNAIRARGQA